MELIHIQNLSLSQTQIAWLMPYLILTMGGMATLLVGVMKVFTKDNGAIFLNHNFASAGMGILTLLTAIYSIHLIWAEPSLTLFNGMLAGDYYSQFFNLVLLIATALVMLSSYSYLEKEGIHHSEYYSLMLFSCLGMMLLASALDLIVLFIALEMMSIAIYSLVGFRRTDVKSNEAAVKYFILGSAASAIFLYGIALVYGTTGTLNIHELAIFLKTNPAPNVLFSIGVVLVVVGFLFKIASVPFHMWMPDVYEGAPTTVTNFMTTGLKAAVFASFMRVFLSLGYADNINQIFSMSFHHVLWVIAVLTMFLGNVIALVQRNIKRMLAYSSIAHSGYILLGFIAAGKSEISLPSVVLYLVAYVIMNLGAFAIIALFSEQADARTNVEDYAGLGFRHPALGFAMTVFMLSLAGIPPTAGFAGKYLIFTAAIQAGEIPLTLLAVLCSAISAYYYLRVVVYMYMHEPTTQQQTRIHFTLSTTLVILATTIATLQFGLFPSLLINAAKKAAMSL